MELSLKCRMIADAESWRAFKGKMDALAESGKQGIECDRLMRAAYFEVATSWQKLYSDASRLGRYFQ